MDQYASAIILGIGSSIAAILGAYALVVRARGAAAEPRYLLRRLWDWIEATGLTGRVPPTLAREVQRSIDGEREREADSDLRG